MAALYHGSISTPSVLLLLLPCFLVPAASNPAHDILPRQTSASDLIDPVTMGGEDCENNECWRRRSLPPEICPLVDGPCPDNENATDNGGGKCGMKQYRRDCYCNLKTGLYCTWSCDWKVWWDAEDWLARVCPESPALKLDFSSLPSCARQCLDDAIFEYGCLTQSSNCFCAKGYLFGCHNHCFSEDERRQVADWLADACDLNDSLAVEALASGYFTINVSTTAAADAPPTETKGLSPPKKAPRGKPSWGEDLIFAVLGITVLTGLGLWIYGCVDGRKAHVSKRG